MTTHAIPSYQMTMLTQTIQVMQLTCQNDNPTHQSLPYPRIDVQSQEVHTPSHPASFVRKIPMSSLPRMQMQSNSMRDLHHYWHYHLVSGQIRSKSSQALIVAFLSIACLAL